MHSTFFPRALPTSGLIVAICLAPLAAQAQEKPTAPAAPTTPAAPATPDPAAEAEDVSDTPAVDPTKQPAAGKGVVWGVLRSAGGDKETLLDAQVTVVGKKVTTSSDLEGRYRLELPPGFYAIRVVYDLHKPVRVKNVRVVAGRIARLDISLQPDSNATEESVAVEAEVERASTSTQLLLRKNSATASDAVGAQEIAKSPDRNAADAIRRVVGATVVDGKYVVVRGLGDRYMGAMLNSSPLPSPEPDRQAVPLDMFPTLVLSDLTVKKTFTPDMPGDFAGGMLDIHTREIPQKFLFIGNFGLGFNTNTTFRDRLSYPGGSLDFLGFDDGGRKVPKEIPQERLSAIDPVTGQRRDLTAYGRAVNGPMETEPAFSLPNGNGSFVLGNSFKTGKSSSLGFLAGASYSRKFQTRRDGLLATFDPALRADEPLRQRNDYGYVQSTDSVTWSGIGQLGYTFNENHKIIATGLYSRNADKEGRLITGLNGEGQFRLRDERLRFQARGLGYGQLRGEHRFRELSSSVLEWRALYARATADDPNLRETVFNLESGQLRDSSQSGQHYYAGQGETSRAIGLDYTQPLGKDPERPRSLKFGGLLSFRSRSFDARRLRFVPQPNATNQGALSRRPNDVFTDENINNGNILLTDDTKATDSYAAKYNTYAAYAMADLSLLRNLRIVVGERIESSQQTVDTYDPFSAVAADASSHLNRTDWLPSAVAIVKLGDKSTVRAAAFRTVARPQLRELAPVIFTEFLGAREQLGNPELDRTQITNFDARFEFYPSTSEVLAVSVFYKKFEKPIEPTVRATGAGIITFANADGATNAGVELEARKNLGFATGLLKEFTFIGNLTLLYSQVEISPEKKLLLTNTSRPLAGQSPYVMNLSLDWEHAKTKTRARVLYNVAGPRVSQVGYAGLPDFYEQPRHILDASVAQSIGEHVDVKASIENLLNAPVRFTQGDGSGAPYTERYTLGQTLWVSASYTY
ncbi:MAG: TonB-dependent receptor [Polyangiaceae bacterium]|nr:TonB-dependent receptor [Polyangiaceae bacterium]